MRKPIEFVNHPLSFKDAQALGVMRANVRSVIDGDTYDLMVDAGFLHYPYVTVRLRGADTPELFRPADADEKERAREATIYAQDHLETKKVLVRSYKDAETFGRFVADIWVQTADPTVWSSFGLRLIQQGHAVESKGGPADDLRITL